MFYLVQAKASCTLEHGSHGASLSDFNHKACSDYNISP